MKAQFCEYEIYVKKVVPLVLNCSVLLQLLSSQISEPLMLSTSFFLDSQCERVTGIRYGRIEEVNGQLVFSCIAGYKLVGAESLNCSEGKWSDEVPVCQSRLLYGNFGHVYYTNSTINL